MMHHHDQSVARRAMIDCVLATDAADDLFQREPVFNFDEICWLPRKGHDDIRKGTRSYQPDLAARRNIPGGNMVFFYVTQSTQLAAQFFEEKPELTAKGRVHQWPPIQTPSRIFKTGTERARGRWCALNGSLTAA